MQVEDVVRELKVMNDERDWDQFHSPANLAKSISIEAGELLECFQWSDTDFNRQHVKEELADVLSYCLMLTDKLDMDPMAIVHEKMKSTREKYPIDKARGKRTKYTEL